MIRERPSSAPPSCCRLRSENDPVREDGGPSRERNLARPRVVLARSVQRIVIVEGTVDGEVDNSATMALRDYESTEGCLNNPLPVRHTTEGGGAGLGSSGVHDCSRPPSSSARLDEWETQRALVEASRLVETAQGPAQARGRATAQGQKGARGRGATRGRGRAQGRGTAQRHGAAKSAISASGAAIAVAPASDPSLLVGRGPGARSTRGRVHLDLRAAQPDQQVLEVLGFHEISSSAAWSLGELAASTQVEEQQAACTARAMLDAGGASHALRVHASLSVEGRWQLGLPASSHQRPSALQAAAPAKSVVQRRRRKAAVLGSPSERRVRPSGVQREEDNEAERHLREVKGLLQQIPERFHGSVFRRAMEEKGGGSSMSEVPRAVQEATLAKTLLCRPQARNFCFFSRRSH